MAAAGPSGGGGIGAGWQGGAAPGDCRAGPGASPGRASMPRFRRRRLPDKSKGTTPCAFNFQVREPSLGPEQYILASAHRPPAPMHLNRHAAWAIHALVGGSTCLQWPSSGRWQHACPARGSGRQPALTLLLHPRLHAAPPAPRTPGRHACAEAGWRTGRPSPQPPPGATVATNTLLARSSAVYASTSGGAMARSSMRTMPRRTQAAMGPAG